MSSLKLSFGINPDSKATYIQKKSSCSLSSYRSQQHQYGWIPAHHHHHPSCRQMTQTPTRKDSSSRTFDIKNANGGLYVAWSNMICISLYKCILLKNIGTHQLPLKILPHHGTCAAPPHVTSYPVVKPWHLHWSHI